MPSSRGRRGGRRAQRAHRAHAAVRIPDPALAVERALDLSARETVLAAAVRRWPGLSGAGVADVLAIATDGDLILELTEPWWDAHGDALASELGDRWQVISPALRAAALLLDLPDVSQPMFALEVFERGANGPLGPAPDPGIRHPDRLRALYAGLPPAGFSELATLIAWHAASGADAQVSVPERGVCWLAADGTVQTRHPLADELDCALSGECDACPHPLAAHAGGACERVHPRLGPCPCAHTSPAAVARQHELWQRHR